MGWHLTSVEYDRVSDAWRVEAQDTGTCCSCVLRFSAHDLASLVGPPPSRLERDLDVLSNACGREDRLSEAVFASEGLAYKAMPGQKRTVFDDWKDGAMVRIQDRVGQHFRASGLAEVPGSLDLLEKVLERVQ